MNSTSKRLTFNAASAIIQVAFTAFIFFFLYKYLLGTLGLKQLGVWSLILSFSSIANFANLGLTSGLVKFVAEYKAEKKIEKTGKLILTAITSLSILFLFISILVYIIAKPLLHYVIEEEYQNIAYSLLPWSLSSLTFTGVGSVFTSVLEGYQKNYLRNLVLVLSGAIMFTLTLMLTPQLGLKGVAIAQLSQAIFVLIASGLLVFRLSPDTHFSKWKWSNSSFKEMFNYGYKFQVVSICQLLYEPTTKMLLSKFGGLTFLGNYEMASKLINQFRALLVNANQVVIPVVSETAKVKTKDDSVLLYKDMTKVISLFAIPLSTLLILLTPIISVIWIGHFNSDFIFAMYILTISAIFNILCGPAYFSCMGEGRLNILVTTHVAMAVLNLILGFLLGLIWGGYGIVIGWGLALTIGSIYLIWKYNFVIEQKLTSIFTRNEFFLFLVGALSISISIIMVFLSPFGKSVVWNLILSIPLLLAFIPIILKNSYIRSAFNKIKRS
jgi:O-antigen/teichoic acid export membrane protein